MSQCHVQRCLAVMCHAPAPSHHRLLPRANSCRALCPNPTAPPWAIAHLTPYPLSILPLLACHPLPTRLSSLSRRSFHPFVVSTPALPILVTLPSMTCVLKRFPFTSPRKLALTCVKWGFLRTAEPHRTSQLSPCAPLMSQCHVYVMPGRDVACPAPSPRSMHLHQAFPFSSF